MPASMFTRRQDFIKEKNNLSFLILIKRRKVSQLMASLWASIFDWPSTE
jgi:hypothetical protein